MNRRLAAFEARFNSGSSHANSANSVNRPDIESPARPIGTNDTIGTGEREFNGGWIASQAATAGQWDAGDWRDFYEERAAVRQFEGGYTKPEAEALAWGEAVTLWHGMHGAPALPAQCAGCGKPCSSAEESMTLPDGARVHGGGFDCLTAYGLSWRGEAEAELLAFGLLRPDLPL